MKYTRHSTTRLRQRGFRKGDVELILENGTEISHEKIMLKRRDADKAIQKRKREIAKLERLVGMHRVSERRPRTALPPCRRPLRTSAGQTPPGGGMLPVVSGGTGPLCSGTESVLAVQRNPRVDQADVGCGSNTTEQRLGEPIIVIPTWHSGSWLQQRVFRKDDVELILEDGPKISPKKIVLKQRDVDEAIRNRKREIAAIERLKNTTIVVADGHLVTAYHANGKRCRPRFRHRNADAFLDDALTRCYLTP